MLSYQSWFIIIILERVWSNANDVEVNTRNKSFRLGFRVSFIPRFFFFFLKRFSWNFRVSRRKFLARSYYCCKYAYVYPIQYCSRSKNVGAGCTYEITSRNLIKSPELIKAYAVELTWLIHVCVPRDASSCLSSESASLLIWFKTHGTHVVERFPSLAYG